MRYFDCRKTILLLAEVTLHHSRFKKLGLIRKYNKYWQQRAITRF